MGCPREFDWAKAPWFGGAKAFEPEIWLFCCSWHWGAGGANAACAREPHAATPLPSGAANAPALPAGVWSKPISDWPGAPDGMAAGPPRPLAKACCTPAGGADMAAADMALTGLSPVGKPDRRRAAARSSGAAGRLAGSYQCPETGKWRSRPWAAARAAQKAARLAASAASAAADTAAAAAAAAASADTAAAAFAAAAAAAFAAAAAASAAAAYPYRAAAPATSSKSAKPVKGQDPHQRRRQGGER
eukprot:scaffold23527_cov61-Phaeocystis_antarctica.AAC.6